MIQKFGFHRWLRLGSLVGVCLLIVSLVVGTGGDAPALSTPATPSAGTASARNPTTAAPVGDLDLALLNRPNTEEIEDRLFTSPAPPAPPPTAKPAVPMATTVPPTPVAPPLPFKFIGRLIDRNVTTAFVVHANQTLGIKEGDEVDKLYRVEHIQDDRVVFVYLPLHQTQTLLIGARP